MTSIYRITGNKGCHHFFEVGDEVEYVKRRDHKSAFYSRPGALQIVYDVDVEYVRGPRIKTVNDTPYNSMRNVSEMRVPLNYNIKALKKYVTPALKKRIKYLDSDNSGCFKMAFVVGDYVIKVDLNTNTTVKATDSMAEVFYQHTPEGKLLPIARYLAWGYVDGCFMVLQRRVSVKTGSVFGRRSIHWTDANEERFTFECSAAFRHSNTNKSMSDVCPTTGHNVGWCKAERRLVAFDWGINADKLRCSIDHEAGVIKCEGYYK